jgi:hypothetical protein
MLSGSSRNDEGEWRNKMVAVANAQPFPKIMPERQAELLAGLHQTEHAIARLPTIAAHGAAVISFA